MLRVPTPPRADWRKTVESQGLLYHTIDGKTYWDEEVYYLFEAAEIDRLETAAYRLNEMCLEAVAHVLNHRRLDEFDIPSQFHDYVAKSWENDEHTIYGRFDLSYDGVQSPKLLEYNADTPTSLLEAAVIQWFWSRDLLAPLGETERANFDQFNSIHERLIEAWDRVKRELGGRVHFSAVEGMVEDLMTVTYLRDTAAQAGLKTDFLDVKEIGWHAGRRAFTDVSERSIELMFKLYPWEWMLQEPFGRHLSDSPIRWLEAPWKMLLSNKAILPVLYELFPNSPYLLRASFEPTGDTYVVKPIHSREGANVAIVENGETIAETGGEYGGGRYIYQEFHPLPDFDGHFPVVGAWIVNGHACGVGIREDDDLITRDTSRFTPHIFRKSTSAKIPIIDSSAAPRFGGDSSAKRVDPLSDPWLDR
jgi:glutathionylspermidine synthase